MDRTVAKMLRKKAEEIHRELKHYSVKNNLYKEYKHIWYKLSSKLLGIVRKRIELGKDAKDIVYSKITRSKGVNHFSLELFDNNRIPHSRKKYEKHYRKQKQRQKKRRERLGA